MLEPELVFNAYPDIPVSFRRAMLTEYLQCKALGYIFNSTSSTGLVFMGGTALRVFYGTRRFSEDLDFDCRSLTRNKLEMITDTVAGGFRMEGAQVDVSLRRKDAFSAVFRFTEILQKWDLTGHRDQVLKLKLDASPQYYSYDPVIRVLNRLDVTALVPVASDSLILAQKLHAILQRNRVMGRDLYDAAFLFGRTLPEMNYLEQKQGTSSAVEIADKVRTRIQSCSMTDLVHDVASFLPNRQETMKVELFPGILEEWAASSC